ncbi:acyltransferase family protein [Polynucleobacter sp. MWH-UH23A]|uniref:acyltransferase family protein n=1 Tax=Polynucleobacter sp. MWH-UH23A TaxID=1855613 RepID=UPI003365137E
MKRGSAHIPYRPDIDGLRAVAVISVLLFHLFPNRVPGGFIGVDIFFVISGYLITLIIFHEAENNLFTLKSFYIRRIRRLFPALIFVLLFVAIIGYVTLFANELRYLGKHILGASIFIENFLYMSESTYFNQSHQKILLNIWSLSLEEQFYLLWPPIVMLCIKKRILPIILICMLASFLLNIFLVKPYPIENFFLLATRAWELLLGSLLAYTSWKNVNWTFFANSRSLIGSALIILGLFITNKESNFPGMVALLPALGATLLISHGPKGLINQYFLSTKPLVYFGLISYPLYLWHWPLLALAKTYISESLSTLHLLMVAAFSIVMAIFTFHIIERNIVNIKGKFVAVFLSILLMLVAACGAYFYFSNGAPSRHLNVPFKSINFGEIAKANKSNKSCQLILQHAPISEEICLSNSPEPELLIIGDSHAVSLFTPLLNSPNLSAAIIAGNSCYLYPYFSYTANPFEKHGNYCDQIANSAIEAAKKTSTIKTILITNKMPSVSENTQSKYLANNKAISELEAFIQGNSSLINAFQKLGKKVVYIIDVPPLKKTPADCERLIKFTNQSECEINVQDFKNQRMQYLQAINQIHLLNPSLVIYDPIHIFCDESKCAYKTDIGQSLYIDKEHISPTGALKILEKIQPLVKSERSVK